LLILSAAFACAAAQAPFAFAKPPEEEAAERAERAAERAAKAAERASDSADRAADREARDRTDGSGKDNDRTKDREAAIARPPSGTIAHARTVTKSPAAN